MENSIIKLICFPCLPLRYSYSKHYFLSEFVLLLSQSKREYYRELETVNLHKQ